MRTLLLLLGLLVGFSIPGQAQGTITFETTQVISGALMNIAVYYRTSPIEDWHRVQPSEPPSNTHSIPGTDAGQIVSLQAYAWEASFGLDPYQAWLAGARAGNSDVKDFALGPTAGPGTVIFIGATGTSPNSGLRLTVPLTGPYPAPPVVPEPTTLTLAAVGGWLLLQKLRRRK